MAHYGNFVVSVRTYAIAKDDKGNVIHSKPVIDTPTFVMGGIAGQAMSANDVVTNVSSHMFPRNTEFRDMWINGIQAIDYPNATEQIYVTLYPYQD